MSKSVNYDIHWKRVIQKDFKAFITFFLPQLLPHLDFKQIPTFLDKELHNLDSGKLKGKREGDNLVKIYLKDGKEKWILIHIEVQSQADPNFPIRMFTYYYRIWDKYQKDIISIAIFASNIKAKKEYKHSFFGTEILYKYNIFEVKNMKGREKELEKSDNIFSAIILASLYAYQTKTKKKIDQRLHFKQQLLKLLFTRKYSETAIKELFIFIDNVLPLPALHQNLFYNEVAKLTDMESKLVLTESNRRMIKELAKIFLGTNLDEQAVLLKEQREALQEKDEALQEKNEALQAIKAKQAKQIIHLYDSQKMTDLGELAAFFEVDITFVEEVLNNR